MSDIVKEISDLAARAGELAKSRGADAAEVIVRDGSELTATVRLGEPELVQEAGHRALGLRLFVDSRCALTYTSDMREHALDDFIAHSVEMAKLAEPDELNELPPKEALATNIPDLDLYDEALERVDAAYALETAAKTEKAARDADERINNSDGATFSKVLGAVAFANTDGFCSGYRGSYASFYVQPLCEDADGKKRNGFWWTGHRFLSELEDAEAVGREATRRTVAQLGASKVDTCEVPVVFEPEVGRSIVGMVFSVANGSAFYRKSSYLLDREGKEVASKLVTIADEPHIPRAPGSRPFDGDGLPTRNNLLVEDGILRTVLCDVYSARKLGRESTGSAGRSVGGSPGPTTSNLILRPGSTTRESIIKEIDNGFYVTSMMGFGFNGVTGDFSKGAQGFWIENGELGRPISEVTISANFDDLLKRIDRVGDDLNLRTSTACPTFRVSHMTVGGR